MTLRTLLAIASLSLAASAFAQAPAGKPAPHGCQKPGEHPGRLATDQNRRKWTNDANAYLECLKKYVTDNTAAYNQIFQQAKPYLDAVNSATDEYNKSVKVLKEEADRNN